MNDKIRLKDLLNQMSMAFDKKDYVLVDFIMKQVHQLIEKNRKSDGK